MSQPRMIAERYEVLAEIGRGGMGMVARAFDHRLQTEVALKILRRDVTMDAAQTDSLIKEARILARLSHPSVVRLFDLAETEFGLMLILEYVRGPNLSQVLKARKKLTETELLFIMRQICAGLDAAHAEGIIHRDLKPPNLLVAADSESFESFKKGVCTSSFLLNAKVKITDFGISKLLASRAEVNAGPAGGDGTWSSAGTPLFMSPEQFLGQPSTPETDIYALGVVAYQALSGSLPFFGDSVEALQQKHLAEKPKPIEECSPRINKAILRALEKRPEDRFSSAHAFLAALEGTDEAAAALPGWQPDALDLVGMWAKSHMLPVSLGCVGLLAVPVAGLLYLAHLPSRQATVLNNTATQSAPPNFGKRLTLPEDMDVVPEITNLPARSPAVAVKAALPGPHRPRISWTALIDTEYEPEPWVDGVGPDGTVYFRESQLNTLWAIGDGVLRWAYRSSQRDAHMPNEQLPWQSHADFRDPGRMWLALCSDERNRSCSGSVFNADGAGGHIHPVPAGLGQAVSHPDTTLPFAETDSQNWRWPRDNPRLFCTSRLNKVSLSDRDKRWSLPLEGHATFAASRDDGAMIVSSSQGVVYALDQSGQIQWTYRVDGPPDNMQIMPSGDVVILEKDRQTLVCVRAGKLRWAYRSEEMLEQFEDHVTGAERLAVADVESTLYFLTGGGTTGTAAVDRDGKLLWKLPWNGFVNSGALSLDSRGRLFFSFALYQINKHSRGGVICISDKG